MIRFGNIFWSLRKPISCGFNISIEPLDNPWQYNAKQLKKIKKIWAQDLKIWWLKGLRYSLIKDNKELMAWLKIEILFTWERKGQVVEMMNKNRSRDSYWRRRVDDWILLEQMSIGKWTNWLTARWWVWDPLVIDVGPRMTVNNW